MHAAITSVENLLAGNNVFLIPHFQRSYSWTEKQWQRLWTDLLALPEDAPASYGLSATPYGRWK